MSSAATLHILCGKIASGKSTLAAKLAQPDDTILIEEDIWLAALFASELKTPADYLSCAGKLRAALSPHIKALLHAGLSVVLDFQANTLDSRKWMRGILDDTGALHRFHVLDVPDAVCLQRLRIRNAQGDHPFQVTEAQYLRFSKHFVPPTPDERFNVIRHSAD